ncbi:hypothetical protein JN11_00586 [Mucilaginibacter frigoritolerans]|uniref:Uncharacterized protein n=1 Tax=Mucilaginibacter frigoritolerans TaxID=652788 RepID=A0A562UGG8_9SPHI|nr:hypothetical protein [Mucilaginibacter frigoritolerans]TWJ04863.1 hypothetical protein JN11_00586 [Mucilaginibacter frigoritolerans]
MKRIFAIVLLGIHLFNLGGYVLLYRYYIHQSDVQMVKQIFDNKIDDTKLVEIKIPVNMPTIQDWNDYEVIEGQIQLKDAYYNYVRLKMTRDTMYFICIANETKTRLEHANIITAKEINDVPLTKKGEAPVSKKVNTLSEYNLQAFEYDYVAFGTNLKQTTKPISLNLSKPYIKSPGKPPNFIA